MDRDRYLQTLTHKYQDLEIAGRRGDISVFWAAQHQIALTMQELEILCQSRAFIDKIDREAFEEGSLRGRLEESR